MIGRILHVGITVSDIDRSIDFYKNILGLKLESRTFMEGESTDILFGGKNMRAELAYLNGGDNINCPPVEIICFSKNPCESQESRLHQTSISEICFEVDDIFSEYERLRKLGVEFISEPQEFLIDGVKSKAVYFKDPDGIILELAEY